VTKHQFLPEGVHGSWSLLVATTIHHGITLAHLKVHQGQNVKDVMTATQGQSSIFKLQSYTSSRKI
jgi:hypothetical protein